MFYTKDSPVFLFLIYIIVKIVIIAITRKINIIKNNFFNPEFPLLKGYIFLASFKSDNFIH